MSVFKKHTTAFENRDAEAMIACYHDDYTFVRHQTGTTMNKSDMAEMLRGMVANSSIRAYDSRCLYENDEILVSHIVVDFPDGSREAILSFERLKDGQILHTETGATLITKES